MIDEGLVFVTNNRRDFHALIGRAELHPGLVVLVENAARAREIEHFRAALEEIVAMLAAGRDMINSVVEVEGDGTVTRFELPPLE